MKSYLNFILFFIFSFLACSPLIGNSYDKARVIIMSDIGGSEPDDKQSFIRFLLYANEIDIVGLIGANSRYGATRGDIGVFHSVIDGYAEIVGNLNLHSSGFPSPAELRSKTYEGQRQYIGMEGVGAGHDTDGSEFIKREIQRSDPRPIWLLAWGGTNTLAQALWSLQNEGISNDELSVILKNIRVYDINGQDDSAVWIAEQFPELFYIRSTQFWAFSRRKDWSLDHPSQQGNINVASQSWFFNNIMYEGSDFGRLYPDARYMYEGDSPSFMYLVKNGLGDPEFPHFGTWGGRFLREADPVEFVYKAATDDVEYGGSTHSTIYTAQWRWREEYQNDFAARIDWTKANSYSDANHQPLIVLNGATETDIQFVNVGIGKSVELDALGTSDPDGDAISYNWWYYLEPGTYGGELHISNSESENISVTMPLDAMEGDSIHIILSVKDNGTPRLTSYRRVVLIAGEKEPSKIMNVGDRLVQGIEGGDTYRRSLWNLLLGTGKSIDFIGTQNTVAGGGSHENSDFDLDHEGYADLTIREYTLRLSNIYETDTPDVAIVLTGQQDILSGSTDVEIINDMENLFTSIRSVNPNVTILLGNLPISTNQNVASRIEVLNAELLALAVRATTDESIVFYVDHSNVQSNMLYNDIQLNQQGEDSVARNWFNPIIQALDGTLNPYPMAPSSLISTNESINGISLTWLDNANNESNITIERAENGGGFNLIAQLGENSRSYTDTDIQTNRVYTYRVYSSNAYGSSDFSNEVTIETNVPSTPTSLEATDIRSQKVTLNWIVENGVNYTVERAEGDFSSFNIISSVAVGRIDDLYLEAGVTYRYRVTGENNFGTYADSIDVTTDSVAISGEYTVKINFASSNSGLPDWNDIPSSSSGILATSLIDDLGNEIPITLEQVDDISSNTYGEITGDNSGIFPDAVLQTNYYEGSGEIKRFILSGLNDSAIYSLTLSGSREESVDRITVYSVQGEELMIDVAQNTSLAAVFENVHSNNGIIEFSFTRGVDSRYGYLCGLIVNARMPVKPSVNICYNVNEQEGVFYYSGACSQFFGNLDDFSINWNFGDGNFSSELETNHSYAEFGEYLVSYSITDSLGNTYLAEFSVFYGNSDAWLSTQCVPDSELDSVLIGYSGLYYMNYNFGEERNIYIESSSQQSVELGIRYHSIENIENVNVLVNSNQVATLSIENTQNEWNSTSVIIDLEEGINSISFVSSSNLTFEIDELFFNNNEVSFVQCESNTYTVSEGWNMLSVSLIPYNMAIDQVLQGAHYSAVKNEDLFYMESQRDFLNTLKVVELGNGYFFYFTESGIATIAGLQSSVFPAELELNIGWNLVGINLAEHTETSTLFETYPNLTTIKDFDGFKVRSGSDLGLLNTLEVGRAYWMLVE